MADKRVELARRHRWVNWSIMDAIRYMSPYVTGEGSCPLPTCTRSDIGYAHVVVSS
jgi:hypothetical protein